MGFCDRFASMNHTPVRSIIKFYHLGLIGVNSMALHTLEGTWQAPSGINQDTTDILTSMKITPEIKRLG